MKITYNPKYNVAYLALKEKHEEVSSVKLSEDVYIDISHDGTLYGIELLNANEQLNEPEQGKLTFTNLISGKTQELNMI